jgi:hypothetical protein
MLPCPFCTSSETQGACISKILMFQSTLRVGLGVVYLLRGALYKLIFVLHKDVLHSLHSITMKKVLEPVTADATSRTGFEGEVPPVQRHLRLPLRQPGQDLRPLHRRQRGSGVNIKKLFFLHH